MEPELTRAETLGLFRRVRPVTDQNPEITRYLEMRRIKQQAEQEAEQPTDPNHDNKYKLVHEPRF